MRKKLQKIAASILCAGLVFFGSSISFAEEQEKHYGPTLDLNGRIGNNRNIGRIELTVPLQQEKDKLLFADIRTVWDDQDEREGNFGLGYREVKKIGNKDFIVGGYGFFDRRKSESNNYFSQITIGAEALGNDWRGRANYYHPTTGEKTVSDGADSATLRADGFVLVDNDRTVETALKGLDLELGYRIPKFEKHETWVHGGVYKFGMGDDINLNGVRFRAETQVNEYLRLGWESSYDNIRKDNHFFDIRVRVPLNGKTKKSKHKPRNIYRYMQEPIVRDIDIVTNAKKQKPALAKGPNGKAEKYIFVDNTAAGGGDGTPITPYNNLADAQAALSVGNNNKTIFVRQGDGTTTNMNSGITIDDNNARFLGSGINLTTREGVLVELATAAPQITHTAGDAVTVAADDIEVAGFHVNAPSTDGIFVLNQDSTNIHDNLITGAGNNGISVAYTDNKNYNVFINDNTMTGNALRGLRIRSFGGADVTAQVNSNTANSNTQDGFRIEAGATNSTLVVNADNNTTNNNGGNAGLYSLISTDADYTLNLTSHTANSNTQHGVFTLAGGSGTHQIDMDDVTADSNGQIGISTDIQDSSTATVTSNDTQSNSNGSDGYNIITRSDTSSTVTVTNHTSTGNTQQGVDITATGTTASMTLTASNITSTGNSNGGMFVRAQSNGTMNATLSALDLSTNTGGPGIFLEGQSTGSINASISQSDFLNNTLYGIQLSDTTSGTYNIDFGGGGLGSTGQNRTFGSGGFDVFGNLNGSAVSAQSNWWGSATGLDPSNVNLISGGSIDSTNFLTTDPRP